jgi:hypothetical protein
MALEFYEAIRQTSSLPNVSYKEDLQAMIDDQFDNASSLASIKQEQIFGTLVWSEDFTVRLTHVVSDKNTGEKLGDDFRNLIFGNINYNYLLGKRYSFSDNYWITINTDNYKYVTASACIRRCNNVLKHYTSTGDIHSEPCIIDTGIRSVDFDFNQHLIIPDGSITVIVQGNLWTKEYKINQRFIIDEQPWKCEYVNNYQRTKTLDKYSVNLIRLILRKDSISANDTALIEDTGSTNTNTNTDDTDLSEKYSVVTPSSRAILQGEEITYSIYSYLEDDKLNDTFTITASGVPSDFYTINILDGNTFKIKNIKLYTASKLHIACKNNIDNIITAFDISLKGVW